MSSYRVQVERLVREMATVDVDADNIEHAKDVALDAARRGNVAWSNENTVIEIFGAWNRELGKL